MSLKAISTVTSVILALSCSIFVDSFAYPRNYPRTANLKLGLFEPFNQCRNKHVSLSHDSHLIDNQRWNKQRLSMPALKVALPNEDSSIQGKRSIIIERLFDTMTPAGFDEPPLLALSGKKAVIIFVLMFGWKWYRAKFLLKQNFMEKQPAWGHVITSKEQESVLHAWTCKECGTTMFIAKGREIRFFNRFVECYNCGARGKESFYDRREEIAATDDTDFEYENPLDYVANGERKQMETMQKKLVVDAVVTESNQATDVIVEEKVYAQKQSIDDEELEVMHESDKESSDSETNDDDLDLLGMDL